MLLPTVLLFTACGGSSSDDAGTSANETATKPAPINSAPMFSQGATLYSFDTSSSGLNHRFSHTLTNNVISRIQTQTVPSVIFNRSSFGDIYLLDESGVHIQADLLKTPDDQPAATDYFISDDGATLTTSFYNSAGVFPIIRKSLTYTRHDVSGLKVKTYIYKNLLTSSTHPVSAAALSASETLFPQGSVVFVPGETTLLDEHYEIKAARGVSYPSFDAVPNIEKYPLTRTFGGIDIRYSNTSSLGYAAYNGKIYQTYHNPKNQKLMYNPDNNYYYNDIAADIVAKELVSSCRDETTSSSGCPIKPRT